LEFAATGPRGNEVNGVIKLEADIAVVTILGQEWDAYSIGEKTDLDNDGENKLIINGPYGGIYLDARDNKVYEFASGEGSALILSRPIFRYHSIPHT
jgi:hypothetical protein